MNNFLQSGLCFISFEEMHQIRGGADVPKPLTRPREVWESNVAVFSQRNTSNPATDILSLIFSGQDKS